jgi:hypothetical protein
VSQLIGALLIIVFGYMLWSVVLSLKAARAPKQ